MDQNKTIFYILLVAVLLFILPSLYKCLCSADKKYEKYENTNYAKATDATVNRQGVFSPYFNEPPMGNRNNKEYTPASYDKTTKTLMRGKTPPAWETATWLAPAWNPDQPFTNSKDAENDTRMVYNKCSLSCCSEQYPVPFMERDPTLYDSNGQRKYIASNNTCRNECGTGCVCITKTQANKFKNGTY